MSQDERFDTLFLAIAQRSNGVEDLLGSFFSFLRRKTDTFNPPGGWPQLESTFMEAVRKQYDIDQQERAKASGKGSKGSSKPAAAAATQTAAASPAPKKAAPAPAPAAAPAPTEQKKVEKQEQDVVYEARADGSFDISAADMEQAKPAVAKNAATNSKAAAAEVKPAPAAATSSSASTVAPAPEKQVQEPEAKKSAGGAGSAEGSAGSSDSSLMTPGPGNGYSTGAYSWGQTLQEVTVNVAVPAGMKGKDVVVEIKAGSLTAGLKGQQPVLQGNFPGGKRVRTADCYWTLEDSKASPTGRCISLFLVKENNMEWWRSVVEGQPELDTTKVSKRDGGQLGGV